MGESSRNCYQVKVKLEIITDDVKTLFESLKPDDVEVRGLNYKSYIEEGMLIYEFESDQILTLRNALDDVLEKASLVEEVLKGTQ
ncbi:hypothetical protein IPA_04900 [Ignicoccus pacificus DSM 13166]|uniref:Uncharacterized protein n=1 Tax=Ignicoccus pacificus DSM 13166 TaxID=940294 RepID=A0A977KB56_9CREN|nr:hypothetical protein IPA_04900 [Ignicoccus pacificus DSM 13166]